MVSLRVILSDVNGTWRMETGKPEQDALWLVPANKSYKPMKVSSLSDFTVWGIVTYIIKKVRSRSRGL